jgi:protein tyrosine phosphatase (PTP) superfamily phosphohydrolase (DUF442 family)
MKTPVLLLCLSLTIGFLASAQKVETEQSVEAIKAYKNLFRYQTIYLSGQPTLEQLRYLKAQGVGTIINLRSKEENTNFSEGAFHEPTIAEELGFDYYSIPIAGSKDYNPKTLRKVSELIGTDEKVLIHCASAGRVTHVFMAYLVKYKGYSINDAVQIGKSIKFTFPQEQLLDVDISLTEDQPYFE